MKVHKTDGFHRVIHCTKEEILQAKKDLHGWCDSIEDGLIMLGNNDELKWLQEQGVIDEYHCLNQISFDYIKLICVEE